MQLQHKREFVKVLTSGSMHLNSVLEIQLNTLLFIRKGKAYSS